MSLNRTDPEANISPSESTRRLLLHVAILISGLVLAATCKTNGASQGSAQAPATNPDESPGAPSLVTGVRFGGAFSGYPRAVAIVGTHLVLLTNLSDTLIRVFDLKSASLEWALRRRKGSIGLLQSAWALSYGTDSRHHIWVFDNMQRLLARIDLEAPSAPQRAIRLISDEPITSATLLSDTLVAATGLFNYSRLAFFNELGYAVRFAGRPPKANDSIPNTVREYVDQGRLEFNRRRQRFVIAPAHSNQLLVLNPDGDVERVLHRATVSPAVYSWQVVNGMPVVALRADTRYGYVDVVASDSLIFGLLSGQTLTESRAAPSGNEVDVFTWDGRLIQTLRLASGRVEAIAADPRSRQLFAVSRGPAGGVIKYQLP